MTKFMRNVSTNYKNAIKLLNTLQSNAEAIEAAQKQPYAHGEKGLDAMRVWWSQLGYTNNDLDSMNIVHVSGTKGKGSVCAYVSYMAKRLFTDRLQSGLFTSPHLRSVRERIRLNDEIISEGEFTDYFFRVWRKLGLSESNDYTTTSLEKGRGINDDRPGYFRFLTLLALSIFRERNRNLVILETGVGGRYDCTNFIAKPCVTGITRLDLDHVHLLGKSIWSIGWHKAGILKPDVPGFVMQQECDEAIQSIANEAVKHDKAANVRLVLSHENTMGQTVRPFERDNQRLAMALITTVLQRTQILPPSIASKIYDEISVNLLDYLNRRKSISLDGDNLRLHGKSRDKVVRKLMESMSQVFKTVKWPGRYDVRHDTYNDRLTWWFDGAHTPLSLQATGKWFIKCTRENDYRILVFNQTDEKRDLNQLLKALWNGTNTGKGFNEVIFTTNTIAPTTTTIDQIKLPEKYESDLWQRSKFIQESSSPSSNRQSIMKILWQSSSQQSSNSIRTTSTVNDVIIHCRSVAERLNRPANPDPAAGDVAVHVLVTGSLRLIGSMMEVMNLPVVG